MLIPKKFKFKAAGRFVEEQVIDFTTLGSFVQIEGKNNNTGGSSGSGKTTFLRMIEYNLGLNDLPVALLQSRFTKDPISTIGEYDWDGTPVTIERNKSKLSVTVGNQVTTGSSKITEEKLDEIIGMPRDLFRKTLYKRQGEGGFFLEMGATETQKFLTSCLKQEEEQKKIVKLDDILKSLSAKETSLKSEIESNKMGLEASRGALNSLGLPPQAPFNSTHFEVLKSESVSAFDTYIESVKIYESEKLELEKSRPNIAISPFDRSPIEQIENEIKSISTKIGELESGELSRQSQVKNQIASSQLEISNLQKNEQARQSEVRSKIATNRLEYNKALNLVRQGDQAKEAAKGLAVELNKIRASICPTCQQDWITDSIKAKESEIVSKITEYYNVGVAGTEALKTTVSLDLEHGELLLEASPRALVELDTLTTKIEQFKLESAPVIVPEALELRMKIGFKDRELQTFRQQERDHQVKENTKNQEILSDFVKRQVALNQKHEPALKVLQDIKEQASFAYEMSVAKQKSFEVEATKYDESMFKLNAQIAKYDSTVTQKVLDLAANQEEIEILEESKKAIKSHLSCSFDDALEAIGDKATRLIRLIPNMANSTIQFEGTKETKEGKIKEEVTCMVSMDGEIGVPIKSLSGGERSSADMCVDLSVIKFIEETTGNGIGFFFIDEGFNGLDTTCIQDALEMLREYSVDKKLFLVEHNPIVSESIENKILVVRDGLTSKIIQQ